MIHSVRLASVALVVTQALATLGPVVAQSPSTPAAPPPTLRQLDPPPPRQGDQTRREEIRNAPAKADADRRAQCLRAFGHAAFCGCLGDQLPPDVSFLTYIQVVASTRQDLGYARLGKEDQKAVDLITAARDGCVAKAFAGQ